MRLANYAPRGVESRYDAVREVVVTAIAATPFVSAPVDRSRCSILYRYIEWLSRRGEYFDVDGHLQDDRLRVYWAQGCTDLAPRSRDKHLSTLRTIADGAAFAEGATMQRYPLAAPYTDTQWMRYRIAADRLPPTWRQHADTLLDLSGELGMRGAEINRARRCDVTPSRGGPIITVTDTAGRTRRVPIPARVDKRFEAATSNVDHILRPDYRNRRNTVSALISRLAHHDRTFEGFIVARARHRWLIRLMQMPIPAATVIAVAGLHGGNHALQDLATHLPAPDWDVIQHQLTVGPGSPT